MKQHQISRRDWRRGAKTEPLCNSRFGSELAQRWNEFAGCDVRTKQFKRFFERDVFSSDMISAIDLAAGIGCEAQWMAPRFKRFYANEVDPTFRRRLDALNDKLGEPFITTRTNWLNLSKRKFGTVDLALLLGNSLCLLPDKQKMRRALKKIRSILGPGSKFVIDQRNFDYMLDSRRSILDGTFRYSGKVVYCGKAITGRPISITPARIVFGYFERRSQRMVGTLDFVPLRLHELVRMLEDSGFDVREKYWDLRPGVNSLADFVTLVCEIKDLRSNTPSAKLVGVE